MAISSIGIDETPLRSVLQPSRKLADVMEASGLDYTILRSDGLTRVNEMDDKQTKKISPGKAAPFPQSALLLLWQQL